MLVVQSLLVRLSGGGGGGLFKYFVNKRVALMDTCKVYSMPYYYGIRLSVSARLKDKVEGRGRRGIVMSR